MFVKYFQSPLMQGRALLNAIGNLELTGAYAEALKKLGHNLEDVAREVKSFMILKSLIFSIIKPGR